MNGQNVISIFWVLLVSTIMGVAHAVDMHSPELLANIEKYKGLLTQWASDPTIVEMVQASNASGGMGAGMTNSKWNFLDENDPIVLKFKHNKAAELILKWESANQTAISKLYLRDREGNLVASSNIKPLIYNNKTKPPFENAIKGKLWSTDEIKPDPGTQVPGVHVSVPVFDAGHSVIGILHSSVIAR